MKLSVDTIHAAAVADDQARLNQEATQSVFGQLAESTMGFTDRKAWEESIRSVEDYYCETVHSFTTDAKTKGRGKPGMKNYTPPRWKYRKLLPAAWSSSKSVCGQAIEHGIKLDADSRKTATEKAIAEKKAEGKTPKTPREKFRITMETAKKILHQLPDDEWEEVLKDFGIDPNSANSLFNWRS